MSALDRKTRLLEILRPGDVLNCDTKPRWWQVWLWIFYGVVHFYQKRKLGKNSRWRDIHSMLYLGQGEVLSVTIPKAVICDLHVGERTRYRICRYLDEEWEFSGREFEMIREAAEKLVGSGYDLFQNADILLKMLFPDFIPETARIFDISKKWKVCSVGVHLCLLSWYYRLAKGLWPRPLGKHYVETTCPADFANHDTFEVIEEGI